LDKKQIGQLATCHFIEHGENAVILGPPGVGKTHLAVGLGLKAIEHGYRVLFTTAAAMIGTLTRALSENRLDEKLKMYTVPRLLDELGHAVDTIEDLADVEFVEDDKEPNGSSIALLVEFEGKSLLLAGDAHPSVL